MHRFSDSTTRSAVTVKTVRTQRLKLSHPHPREHLQALRRLPAATRTAPAALPGTASRTRSSRAGTGSSRLQGNDHRCAGAQTGGGRLGAQLPRGQWEGWSTPAYGESAGSGERCAGGPVPTDRRGRSRCSSTSPSRGGTTRRPEKGQQALSDPQARAGGPGETGRERPRGRRARTYHRRCRCRCSRRCCRRCPARAHRERPMAASAAGIPAPRRETQRRGGSHALRMRSGTPPRRLSLPAARMRGLPHLPWS